MHVGRYREVLGWSATLPSRSPVVKFNVEEEEQVGSCTAMWAGGVVKKEEVNA